MKFQGFPPVSLRFLRALKRNNDRAWFQPKKERYLAEVQAPMQDLILDLGKRCHGFAPDFVFDPKKSVQRVYRDTRFSSDKTPYKTHVAAVFKKRGLAKKTEFPGFYVQVGPKDSCSAGGIYHPTPEMLRKVRNLIQTDPDSWEEVRENRLFRQRFGTLAGETLKTQPRGVDPNHPWIEDLKRKQFFVYRDYSDSVAETADFAKQVALDFKAMLPLIRWLEKASKQW